MNIALWVTSGILAAAFAGAGAMKLMTSKEKLLDKMPWVADASAGQVRSIGAIELLGAVGLILPAFVDGFELLVPLAALGLVLAMVGAVVVHIRRGDGIAGAAPAAVLAGLALFVAIMRVGSESF